MCDVASGITSHKLQLSVLMLIVGAPGAYNEITTNKSLAT
jgi:hypothetical protein